MGLSLAELRRLQAYDDWANARLLDSLAGLSEEQLTRRMTGSFPSLRDTVAHILGAQWIWLRRFEGESPKAQPPWLEAASRERLCEVKIELQSERAAHFDGLRDEDLEREVSYLSLRGDAFRHRLKDLALHVINHSTYHRGQATTLLRQLGATPLGTDFTLFLRETE